MNEQEIVVLLDSVSRTIIGEPIGETDTQLTLKNPAIVNAIPTAEGQMSLQLIPLFFRQLLDDPNVDSQFTFNKGQVTMSNITALEGAIMEQYKGIFQVIPIRPEAPAQDDGKVVELFPTEGQNNG